MRRCVNDPAWAVETAQATGMCEACPGCTAQAQKDEKDRWNLGFFCMGNGITVCNRDVYKRQVPDSAIALFGTFLFSTRKTRV